MMLLMIVWCLLGRATRGRRLTLPSPLNVVLILFLGWTYCGLVLTTMTVTGADSIFDFFGRPFAKFLRLCNAALFFFLAAAMLDTRKKIERATWALLLSMPLVFRAFRSDPINRWHYRDDLRGSGPFVHIGSNELAALFVFGAVFFGLFAFAQRRNIFKAVFLSCAGIYVYGLLYSFSSGAQVAFIAVCALVASVRYRAALVVLLVAVLTMDMWVPQSVRERWEMTEDEQGELDTSAASHREYWKLVWSLFLDSPVYGHSYGSFKHKNPAQMDAHNAYLRILAEQGVVGFALFMGLWWLVLRTGWRLWRGASTPYERQFGFALAMATLGLMFANVFGDRYSHLPLIGQFWVLAGIGARVEANMLGVEAFSEDEAAQASPEAEAAPAVPGGAPAAPQPQGLRLVRPAQPTASVEQATAEPEASAKGTESPPKLRIIGRDPRPS